MPRILFRSVDIQDLYTCTTLWCTVEACVLSLALETQLRERHFLLYRSMRLFLSTGTMDAPPAAVVPPWLPQPQITPLPPLALDPPYQPEHVNDHHSPSITGVMVALAAVSVALVWSLWTRWMRPSTHGQATGAQRDFFLGGWMHACKSCATVIACILSTVPSWSQNN